MRRVLALDPGDRVGWAHAKVYDDGHWEDLKHGISPLKDCALAVHHALNYPDDMLPDYDLVVMEEWALYANKAKEMIGSTFPSVQFIGAVRLSCWLSGTPIHMQGARNKTTALKSMPPLNPPLAELVERGMQHAHDDAHDMDAILHLWHWTFKSTDLTAYLEN